MMNPLEDPLNTLTGAPLASQHVATSFIGPPEVGWIVNIALFGTVAANLAGYLETGLYKNDSRGTKALLWSVVGLNAASTAINCYEVFHYGTSQKRDEATLFMILPIDAVPSILIGCIGALVQTFLLRRAARLFSRQRLLRGAFLTVMGFLIVAEVVGACGSATMNLLYTEGTENKALPFTYNNVTGTYLSICAAVDVSITAALVICLRRHIAGFSSSTDGVLRRLINLGMRTASYTAVFAVGGALVSVSFPQNNIATANALFAFVFPLASLYTLSLISTLASRNILLGATARTTTPISEFRFPRRVDGEGCGGGGEMMRSNKTLVGSIMVDREMLVMVQAEWEQEGFREGEHRREPRREGMPSLDGMLMRPEAALWA